MKKYRTWYNQEIEEVEVIRETEKYVIMNAGQRGERRDAKRSGSMNYFDTWQEANEFLINNKEHEIAVLLRDVAHLREVLQDLKERRT